MKRKINYIAMMSIMLYATTVATAGGPISSDEVAATVQKIDTLANGRSKSKVEKQKTLSQLEKLAGTVRKKYSESSPEAYAELTARICGSLEAIDLPDTRRLYLAQNYAAKALEKAADMSLDTQVKLVRHVQHTVDAKGTAVTGNALADLRKQQAVLWLKTWKRVDSSIDKNWDPEDRPSLNVAPPAATGLPAGVEPAQINDPRLRAQYLADIQANNRKAAEYKLQTVARKLEKRWIPEAKRFLIRSYMEVPDKTKELQTLLGQYVANAADREQILEAVKNKKMPEKMVLKNTTQPAR